MRESLFEVGFLTLKTDDFRKLRGNIWAWAEDGGL